MNKQSKNGINWTDFTLNPVGGCQHACRWKIDGQIAICYAEDQSNRLQSSTFYPDGFGSHYWHPERLKEIVKRRKSAKIFIDSMSDLMGSWVPAEQIEQVLSTCQQASQHDIQILTKNAPRLLQFDFPQNVWVGVSMPPDFMNGKELTRQQQEKMLHKALEVLSQVKAPVRWMSFEPLSWDVSGIVAEYPNALTWAVIGAATNGRRHYQPDKMHVQNLIDVLDGWQVPILFKNNLQWEPFRENYPV